MGIIKIAMGDKVYNISNRGYWELQDYSQILSNNDNINQFLFSTINQYGLFDDTSVYKVCNNIMDVLNLVDLEYAERKQQTIDTKEDIYGNLYVILLNPKDSIVGSKLAMLKKGNQYKIYTIVINTKK